MSSYILVSGLEYLGRFGKSTRLFLLITFIGLNLILLFRFIIIPLLNLNKLGKRLSMMEASDMIGKIFPDIGDKLKNTLQLNNDKGDVSNNLELVNASIEQRAQKLSVVSFEGAIDLSENKKYIKYLLPVLLLGAVLMVFLPNWFTDGTKRVMYFNQEFVAPAPFNFDLLSPHSARQGETYKLRVKLSGEEIPNEVMIYSNLGTYNLTKVSNVEFEYDFVNLSESIDFYFHANGYSSQQIEVDVLKRPVIDDINLMVNYPKHTGKSSEAFTNTGDITIPEGSTIEWKIGATNLKSLNVYFADTAFVLNDKKANNYRFVKQFFKDENYNLVLSSSDIVNADSVTYLVNVIPDKYPKIKVLERFDSSNVFMRFIEGNIEDDYGFSGLRARINVTRKDSVYTINDVIKVNGKNTNQLFSYSIDIGDYNLKAGDRVSYSFVVSDNDAPNGYKSTSSTSLEFKIPEMDELEDLIGEHDESLKSNMDKAAQDAKKMQKEIKKLKQELVNKPSLDWKDKQQLENLIEQQEKFEKDIEKLQEEFKENKQEKENLLDNSDELKEKQEQLQKLMDELMDEELMELFEKLKELMEEMNKEELVENLEQMEQNAENVEDELDRTLELFKNLELDQKLENLEEQIRELAEEQDALKEETEEGKKSNEELAKEQEKLNEKFDEIQKDIDEVQEKNDDLDKPRDLEFDKEMEESIDQEMQDAKENLDQDKSKKSEKNQSKSSEMMKKMADDVAAMKSQAAAAQQKEDMEALRFLLENLVALSYDQEDLMDEFIAVKSSDPKYLSLNREQLAINKATVVVKDSLVALSKRVTELSAFITEELNDLSYNLDKSLTIAESRKTNNLSQHQQYAMTNYNNLALMLSEVLDQMQQQQMQGGPPGSGSCDNPGGSGSGAGPGKMSLQQMKDALAKQIEKMQGGSNPGGQKGKGSGMGLGEKPGEGKGGIPQLTSKEMAKMAAEQVKIRDGLKQLKEDLNKDGSGAGNPLDDLIKDLEDLQDDLINGRVGSEFQKRQQDIYTRLLESEKALRERGFSDERESKEGKKKNLSNLVEFVEYNKKKEAEVEFLRSLPVGLQVYYKTLVNEYFNSVNTE